MIVEFLGRIWESIL